MVEVCVEVKKSDAFATFLIDICTTVKELHHFVLLTSCYGFVQKA